MNREYFIKKAKEYNQKESYINKLLESRGEKLFTYEELMLNEKQYNNPLNFLKRININRLKEITLKNDNPFIYFYEKNDTDLYKFFDSINTIELGLLYFKEYIEEIKGLKALTQKNANSIINNINKTISIIENSTKDFLHRKERQNTIDYLKYIIKILKDEHYTKRQLFQNLLYDMNSYIPSNLGKNKYIMVTNQIIDLYFYEEINFVKTDITLFKKYEYTYDKNITPLILHHGKK